MDVKTSTRGEREERRWTDLKSKLESVLILQMKLKHDNEFQRAGKGRNGRKGRRDQMGGGGEKNRVSETSTVIRIDETILLMDRLVECYRDRLDSHVAPPPVYPYNI